MRGEFILQSEIILLVSCQYSNLDMKQSIPHFHENELNSSLHNIRKYFIHCIHFKVTYDILLKQRVVVRQTHSYIPNIDSSNMKFYAA